MVNSLFSRTYNVPLILHLVSEEGSLVHLEGDSGFGEGSEDFSPVALFFFGIRVNYNVLDVEETVLSLYVC